MRGTKPVLERKCAHLRASLCFEEKLLLVLTETAQEAFAACLSPASPELFKILSSRKAGTLWKWRKGFVQNWNCVAGWQWYMVKQRQLFVISMWFTGHKWISFHLYRQVCASSSGSSQGAAWCQGRSLITWLWIELIRYWCHHRINHGSIMLLEVLMRGQRGNWGPWVVNVGYTGVTGSLGLLMWGILG